MGRRGVTWQCHLTLAAIHLPPPRPPQAFSPHCLGTLSRPLMQIHDSHSYLDPSPGNRRRVAYDNHLA